jgi:hypothetical protein
LDNKAINLLEDEFESRRAKLIELITQTDGLDRLSDHDDWNLFVDWLAKTKEKMEKEIIAGNFTNDHNGYIYHRSALQVVALVEQAIDRFKRVRTKALKDLGELNDQIKESGNG